MAKSSLSVLKLRPATAPMTIRVSQTTLTDLKALQARLKSEGRHFKFEVGDVLEAALKEAIIAAVGELDRLKESASPAR